MTIIDAPVLRDEAEFRMSVPKILDLSLRLAIKTVIALSIIALLILPLAVCDSKDGKQQDAALTDEIDGVTNGVFGGVFEGIGPARRELAVFCFL